MLHRAAGAPRKSSPASGQRRHWSSRLLHNVASQTKTDRRRRGRCAAPQADAGLLAAATRARRWTSSLIGCSSSVPQPYTFASETDPGRTFAPPPPPLRLQHHPPLGRVWGM